MDDAGRIIVGLLAFLGAWKLLNADMREVGCLGLLGALVLGFIGIACVLGG